MSIDRLAKTGLLSFGGVLLGALAGCGTAEYEQRLSARVAELREDTPYKDLHDPMRIDEALPLMVRVPKIFTQSWREGSDDGGKPVDPRRVKAGALSVPDLKITYEAFVPYRVGDDDGQLAYYCSFAAREAKGRAPDPASPFWVQFQSGSFPEVQFAQEKVQCSTPEGRGTTWTCVSASCPQEFCFIDAAGKGSFKKLPGVFEILVREDAGYIVSIIWRVPADIQKEIKLVELARMVGGCVTVGK